MTNYEWLVKTGMFQRFIVEMLGYAKLNDLSGFETSWKIPKMHNFQSDNISNWLQAKHPEPKKYVELNNVLEILRRDKYMFIPDYTRKGKIRKSNVPFNFIVWYDNVLNEIKTMESKEIEE